MRKWAVISIGLDQKSNRDSRKTEISSFLNERERQAWHFHSWIEEPTMVQGLDNMIMTGLFYQDDNI